MNRIAIVSTPRSGNTWLRQLIARLYGLDQYAVHLPEDLNWAQLPENCVVQLHWHRSEKFVDLLKGNQFKVITISRHPLDVLISILHFSQYEPQTANWLNGEGGDELLIHGKLPTSIEFVNYIMGSRAKALLSISEEWWKFADHKLRYEDLVRETRSELVSLTQKIPTKGVVFEQIIDELSIENLRVTSSNNHFWKGQPNIWKLLLTQNIVEKFYAVNWMLFDTFEYDHHSDSLLTIENSTINWNKLKTA